jgi:rfaE bifunctional protein nucleotidyltransferase chain/domain
LRYMNSKVLSRQELAQQAVILRAAGKQIAATNGCFDLLHVGHVRYLQAARQLADVLVVGINSDASVCSLKGPGRPIVPENERAEIIASLSCVDYVNIFPETTAVEFLRTVRPAIYTKGGDWQAGEMAESSVVEDLGGQVKILNLVAQHSTTDLITKIRAISVNAC